MKNLINKYRRWRFYRLYRNLFFLYASSFSDADVAGAEAAKAFQWFTGRDWRKVCIER